MWALFRHVFQAFEEVWLWWERVIIIIIVIILIRYIYKFIKNENERISKNDTNKNEIELIEDAMKKADKRILKMTHEILKKHI